MLRFDVLTLFPGMFAPVLAHSMLKRGQEKGLLTVKVHNVRDFTADRHKVVDDMPYGGGAGMVMKAEPILLAVAALRNEAQANGEDIRMMFPTPHGRPFTQDYAQQLAGERRRIVILCGHYEGVDERVRLTLAPEEVSLGDYVLTGGELPALDLMRSLRSSRPMVQRWSTLLFSAAQVVSKVRELRSMQMEMPILHSSFLPRS